ncbi:MAG: CHAT domain-containing protein [Rubrobacteraceae bacterium]
MGIALREAFAEAHPGAPERPAHHAGLGGTLVTRFTTNGNVQDLDEAIEILEQAVAETPAASPHLSYSLHGLGRGFAARYDHAGDSEDLERADDLFVQVCQKSLNQNVEMEEGLRCARHWGIWASGRKAWNEAVRAYGYADRMMERLVRTQIFRRGQELWLREAQGIPGRYAYALAQMGTLPEAAVALERGRARLLGETVDRNHADLESLKELGRSDLYDRYEAAVRQWNMASRAASEPTPSSAEAASAYEASLVKATTITRTELNAAIEAIRSVPGFELFLSPVTFGEIQTAAIVAPVVYLVATPEGSLALIIADGSVQAVWSDFTNTDLGNLFSRTGDDEDEHYPAYRRVIGGYLLGQLGDADLLDEELEKMLPVLGEALMGPVAERLRSKSAGEVILIPAGLLSLFPLHAARYFRQGEIAHFLDEFDVAYAPNVRALSIARRQSGRITDRRLAGVGNPMPSHNPLKAAEAELAKVVDLFPEGASQPLYAEAATKSALLAIISEGTYLHFACHGDFDPDAVLNSGLLMAAGERLTLGEILYGAVEVSGVRLVALSACQSGISDFFRLPDENTGLPTALMQAGVPGVVGTLWPVNDFSTALLMVKFYDRHLHGDEENRGVPVSPAQALCEAQRWLKDLTLNEAAEMLDSHHHLREALLRTLQNAPHQTALRGLRDSTKSGEDRPFSTPSHWAPFIFVGA